MAVKIESQPLITAGTPFKIVLKTDAPASVKVCLWRTTNGANEPREFALRVFDELDPSAEYHNVDVDGMLECFVEDWGAATAGDAFKVSAEGGGKVATDFSTVG